MNSKINGTPKDVHLPISKLHLRIAHFETHNNVWLYCYGQVNSVRLKSESIFEMGKQTLGITFILLAMAHPDQDTNSKSHNFHFPRQWAGSEYFQSTANPITNST